jgi:outer membrane protein assembly factor BamB
MKRLLVVLAAAFAALPVARADDWPQYHGPTRDGVWAETGIVAKFPKGGPKKLWSVPVKGGYSGPAVAGGKVFVTDYLRATGDAKNDPGTRAQSAGKERILCLDAATGNELWKVEYDCPYKLSYPAGPRATPTVSGGKVYALGAMGNLVCATTEGAVVWSKDFKTDYKVETPVWGFCSHPLIYKNLCVCVVGGDGSNVVAFDKETGKEVWRSLSAPEPGYSAPCVMTTAGVEQVVVFNPKGVYGLDPMTGKRLWFGAVAPSYGMAIMMPRRGGDILFAGGNGQCAAFDLAADKPWVTERWKGDRRKGVYPINSLPMADGTTMYAVDQPGQLRAVDLKDGARLWSTFRPVIGRDEPDDFRGAGSGTAFLARNGDRYFLFGETGRLTIAKLSPGKYEEIDAADLIPATGEAFGRKVVWSAPAFAEKSVFVRNDSELTRFSLADEK